MNNSARFKKGQAQVLVLGLFNIQMELKQINYS